MHISRKVGAKLLSPECVTSLTTVRHSEGPPVADLLTIIKVNTGHTPVQCSAQSCSGTIFI